MNKINRFQLYCLLAILTLPLPYLTIPKLLTVSLENNAWLAVLSTLIPGIILIYMYVSVINKSHLPFPRLLEEHLSLIPGKAIGILYIFFFLLLSSRSLRTFVDFAETNVLPGTPISILIGVMLFISFAAIKAGINNIARMAEIILYIGLPFTFIVVALAINHNPDFRNLQPFGYFNYTNFAEGVYYGFLGLLNLMPVLTLGFYGEKERIPKTMFAVLITYITLITLTTAATIVVLGGKTATFYNFPSFIIIRLITIGEFIQNIDIVFIGLWILGIFGAVTIWWFMACHTIQAVFNLADYRFLAAPSALIVGVFSVAMASNILELGQVTRNILPLFYYFFFFFIPLILFIVTLFKSPVKQELELGETGKVTETTTD